MSSTLFQVVHRVTLISLRPSCSCSCLRCCALVRRHCARKSTESALHTSQGADASQGVWPFEHAETDTGHAEQPSYLRLVWAELQAEQQGRSLLQIHNPAVLLQFYQVSAGSGSVLNQTIGQQAQQHIAFHWSWSKALNPPAQYLQLEIWSSVQVSRPATFLLATPAVRNVQAVLSRACLLCTWHMTSFSGRRY